MSGIQPSLCGFEVTPGAVVHPDTARIGYIAVKPPLSDTYEQSPVTYKAGLSHKGKIIGRNATIPYPGEIPKYHNIPFLRNVDWAGGTSSDTTDPTPDTVGSGTSSRHHNIATTSEIDEYFTAENDEGYRQWEAKQSMTCETEADTTEKLPECMDAHYRQELHTQIPTSAYHYMPVRFPTSNQTYGSYIDLDRNYTIERRLRPKKPTTILLVTWPPPDRSKTEEYIISTMLGIEIKRKSSKTTKIVSYNLPQTLPSLGQREKCLTFPAYCPTGLEMNRIPSTTRSLFSNMAHQQLLTKKDHIHHGKIRPVEKRRLCMPYSPAPANISGAPGYICVQSNELLL